MPKLRDAEDDYIDDFGEPEKDAPAPRTIFIDDYSDDDEGSSEDELYVDDMNVDYRWDLDDVRLDAIREIISAANAAKMRF